MALAELLSGHRLGFLLLPRSSPDSQLFQQAFPNHHEFLHMTTGWCTEVGAIEADLSMNDHLVQDLLA